MIYTRIKTKGGGDYRLFSCFLRLYVNYTARGELHTNSTRAKYCTLQYIHFPLSLMPTSDVYLQLRFHANLLHQLFYSLCNTKGVYIPSSSHAISMQYATLSLNPQSF